MNNNKQSIPCMQMSCGCMTVLLMLLVATLVSCNPSQSTSQAPESIHQPAPPELIEKSFSGSHLSDSGMTRYELNVAEKRFSFFTTIGKRLLLQTEISPYEAHKSDETGAIIEISGGDHQAGGMPRAKFRITKISGTSFELTRVKPVGGSLGVFHKQ
jgi:hypothetical protein